MKNFLNISGPSLTPFVMIFALIILFTIIVSNIRDSEENAKRNEKKQNSVRSMEFRPLLNTRFEPEDERPPDSGAPDTQMLAAAALADWNNGKFAAAEDKFRTVLVFSPNNPIALSHLGAILHHRGDYENAELMFRRQTLYFPGDPGAFQNLGATLAKQHKYKEAINVTKRGLELAPSSPASALVLAKIYSLTGNRQTALDYFRRAAAILGRGILEASWDSAFDNIRETKEFARILREAAKGETR